LNFNGLALAQACAEPDPELHFQQTTSKQEETPHHKSIPWKENRVKERKQGKNPTLSVLQ
jgi:hypothetical protein